jgi:hypothetical protein
MARSFGDLTSTEISQTTGKLREQLKKMGTRLNDTFGGE